MIKTATDDIRDILLHFLPLDIIEKIINIRDKMIRRESLIYWRNITPKYNYIFFGFLGDKPKKLAQNTLIKRINGNFNNLRSENEEIKALRRQNEEWAQAWNRVRF